MENLISHHHECKYEPMLIPSVEMCAAKFKLVGGCEREKFKWNHFFSEVYNEISRLCSILGVQTRLMKFVQTGSRTSQHYPISLREVITGRAGFVFCRSRQFDIFLCSQNCIRISIFFLIYVLS